MVLADAGYWHGEQMQRITDRGVQVLIPPDSSRRRTTRRNWDGGRYDEMRELLATDLGRELYRKRQPMIEPVFAQVKFNRGLDRFRRRARDAVRAEWRLITATHNLLKLHRHTLAAARTAPGTPAEIASPVSSRRSSQDLRDSQASLRQRRSGARTRRRRAYAPDATGPAKWSFR